MDTEAQLIAIAEACGEDVIAFRFWFKGANDVDWRESCHYTDEATAEYWREHEAHWGETKLVQCVRSSQIVRPYLTSLDAMHEAEKTLTSSEQGEYLHLLCGFYHSNPLLIAWPATHATAAQRAEAFLKVKGKWIE